MPPTPRHAPAQDDLPGFAPASHEEELPGELLPGSPTPSTTSESPSPSAPGSATSPTRTGSTTGSIEPEPDPEPTPLDPEVADGLRYLAAGAFDIVGQLINRAVRIRRRNPADTLWLVAEDEAERFSVLAARIAERHLPEELRSGDAADVIIMGSVGLEYAGHNLAGIPGVEYDGAPAPAAPQAAPPPPPSGGAQCRRRPPRAAAPVQPASVGVVGACRPARGPPGGPACPRRYRVTSYSSWTKSERTTGKAGPAPARPRRHHRARGQRQERARLPALRLLPLRPHRHRPPGRPQDARGHARA